MPNAGEIVAALVGAIGTLAGVILALVRKRKRADSPRDQGPAERATLRARLSSAEAEIEKLRQRCHDLSSKAGTVGMVPDLMRQIRRLGERVARLEGERGKRDDADVE